MKRLFSVICLLLTAVAAESQQDDNPPPAAEDQVATSKTQVAATSTAGNEDEIAKITSSLSTPIQIKGRSPSLMTLFERMEHYNVPGVSIAVIHDYEIAWAEGFGTRKAGLEAPVNPDALFQAASISKPVSAIVVLALVEQGKLDFDRNISLHLSEWDLPTNNFNSNGPITIRRLLSHTAGLSNFGFLGYEQGTSLPSLLQILKGEEPANSAAVEAIRLPGPDADYAGAGYVLLQYIIEEVTGERFSDLADQLIFEPLEMNNSYFFQPLNENLQDNSASGHDGNGNPIPGGFRVYPELAPAGLWTTPSDLARLAIEIQKSLMGQSNKILSKEMTQEMLTPVTGIWGLGVEFLSDEKGEKAFYHTGNNAGFKAFLVGRLEDGDGAIVMTNADNGGDLYSEILTGMGLVFDWPESKPRERSAIALEPSNLADLTGRYDLLPPYEGVFIVSVENKNLVIEIENAVPPAVYYATNLDDFFYLTSSNVTFQRNEVEPSGSELKNTKFERLAFPALRFVLF